MFWVCLDTQLICSLLQKKDYFQWNNQSEKITPARSLLIDI